MSQPQIKIRAFFLLVLLAAFPPLSTDMYLPALPSLVQAWNTTEATIILSLVMSMNSDMARPPSNKYGSSGRSVLLTK